MMGDGQEAGEGQAQWREQHRQKSASDINLPIQETERRPAQYSSLANTRGACYISHPSGKKEVSLLENSVPSSGSTNLNASEWRVRLPWRPSPHGLAGNLNCGSLLWASLGLISSPQVLAPSPLVPAGGSLDTLQIPLQLCAVWGIWGEAWHIPEQMELVGGWGWGELVQLQQGLGDHEQRKQMETTDLGLTLLCWVWIQF